MTKENFYDCNVKLSKITVPKQRVTEQLFSAIRDNGNKPKVGLLHCWAQQSRTLMEGGEQLKQVEDDIPLALYVLLAICRLGTALSWSSATCCGVWMIFSFNLCNHFWIYLHFCHPQNTMHSSNVFCSFSIHISSKSFLFTLYRFTFSLPEFNFTFLSFLPSLSFSHLDSSLLTEGCHFISDVLL